MTGFLTPVLNLAAASIRAALALLLSLRFSVHSCAEDRSPAGTKVQGWEIHLEFVAIVVPEAFALPLLDELESRDTASAAYEKIQAEIAAGRATRVGLQRTKSEHRVTALSETVEEVRYPVEFEVPTVPNLNDKKSVASVPKDVGSISMPATTFETRNTGLSLSSSTEVANNGQSLRIEGNCSHTRLVKWDEFASGITPEGAKVTVSQPRFYHASSSGTFYLRAGERILAGIHKLPDQKDTLELFFLRGWTQRKSSQAPAAK